MFHHVSTYHTKFLLGDFNEKLKKKDIFTQTIINESLLQECNDNGVRIVNCHIKKSGL